MSEIHRTTSSGTPGMDGTSKSGDASTVQLVERLTEQVSGLVRTEVAHALEEVKGKSTQLGVGIGISGVGAVLLFFGLGTLIATAVLGLAEAVDPWLAALIVALIVLAIGAVLAALGANRAKKASPPVPERTVESVRADAAAAKEGLR